MSCPLSKPQRVPPGPRAPMNRSWFVGWWFLAFGDRGIPQIPIQQRSRSPRLDLGAASLEEMGESAVM